jgi:hypothetical protein
MVMKAFSDNAALVYRSARTRLTAADAVRLIPSLKLG